MNYIASGPLFRPDIDLLLVELSSIGISAEYKLNSFGSEIHHQTVGLEIFISSTDEKEFNIDISANTEEVLIPVLDAVTRACKKANSSIYLTYSHKDNPDTEICYYKSDDF